MRSLPPTTALLLAMLALTPCGRSSQENESQGEPPTALRFAVDGQVTGLTWPLRVGLPSGRLATVEGRGSETHIPSDLSSLQRIEILGWGSIWLLALPDHEVLVEEHPCCGFSVLDPRRFEDVFAVCPQTPVGEPCPEGTQIGDPGCSCPEDTEALRPAPAEDAVCGAPGRCVEMPRVRLIALTGSAEDLALEVGDGLCLLPSRGEEPGDYRLVALGSGSLLPIRGARGPACTSREGFESSNVALSVGRRYTVVADDHGVRAVHLDR